MFSHASSFLRPLALPLIPFQQPQDHILHLRSSVAFREEFLNIFRPEADFLLLVGFPLGKDVKDGVYVQIPGLAQQLQLNGLGQRRSTILALYCFQQFPLLTVREIRDLHRRSQGDPAVIHHLQDSGN